MADKKISALTSASTPLAGTEVLPIVQSGATVKVAVSDLTAGRTVNVANLGVGATPSAWSADYAVAQFPLGGAVAAYNVAGAPFTAILSNAYYDGTNWKYLSATSAGATNFRNEGYNSDFVWYTAPAGSAGNNITFTSRMTLDSSGNLTNATGNFVVGTSGKGIDFSATPGTGTSELFADYEEGTYTATITVDTGSVTVDPTFNTLSYTKVGRVVVVTGTIVISSVSSPTGYAAINIPFTSANLTQGSSRSNSNITTSGLLTLNANQVALSLSGNAALVYLLNTSGNSASGALMGQQLLANSVIAFTLSYITA
jgi:hypothetical protein